MSLNVIQELRKVGRAMPAKLEPIPLSFNGMGLCGHLEHRRGLYINSGIKHHIKSLIKDHYRAEQAALDVSGGRFGADTLLEIYAKGSDRRDAIGAIKSMRSAITSWDGVVNARGGSKYYDSLGFKNSFTTVAANWSSVHRVGGLPAAYANVAFPGATPPLVTTTGAWPIPVTIGAGEDLYLTNFGQNHLTGTNITFLVDVVSANGSILTSLVTSQNVATTALTRWTGGAGIMMTLEVTVITGTATGVPNVTFNYTDQSGNTANSTGAIAWGPAGTTNVAVGRLLPTSGGPMVQLNQDDYGVRSVEGVIFSASSAGAAGAMALLMYKPHLMVPTLATTTFVERSTPAQIGGIKKLTSVAGGQLPHLSFFVLTSTTSTGIQTYLLEFVYG